MRVFPRQTTRTRPRSCRSDPKGIGGLCQQPAKQPVPPAQMVKCRLCRRRLARGSPNPGRCRLPWGHAPSRRPVDRRAPYAPDDDTAVGRRARRPFGNYGWGRTRGRVGTIDYDRNGRWWSSRGINGPTPGLLPRYAAAGHPATAQPDTTTPGPTNGQ